MQISCYHAYYMYMYMHIICIGQIYHVVKGRHVKLSFLPINNFVISLSPETEEHYSC